MRICQIKRQSRRFNSNESAVRHASVEINGPENVQAIIMPSWRPWVRQEIKMAKICEDELDFGRQKGSRRQSTVGSWHSADMQDARRQHLQEPNK